MAQVYSFIDANGETRLLAAISPAPGGGPAAGTYLPVANASGVTVDTTTYDDTVKGSGKLTTLVFPADQGALAIALAGDAFPRWVLAASPVSTGLLFGDGTVDPVSFGAQLSVGFAPGSELGLGTSGTSGIAGVAPKTAVEIPRMFEVSPRFTITSGALPTATLSSGTGAQISTTRDVETVTPFTGDATNNVATCAVAISADNVTYSTVDTLSIAAALNFTGALALSVNVRIPAGWYLKLTAAHGTIGTTTYY